MNVTVKNIKKIIFWILAISGFYYFSSDNINYVNVSSDLDEVVKNLTGFGDGLFLLTVQVFLCATAIYMDLEPINLYKVLRTGKNSYLKVLYLIGVKNAVILAIIKLCMQYRVYLKIMDIDFGKLGIRRSNMNFAIVIYGFTVVMVLVITACVSITCFAYFQKRHKGFIAGVVAIVLMGGTGVIGNGKSPFTPYWYMCNNLTIIAEKAGGSSEVMLPLICNFIQVIIAVTIVIAGFKIFSKRDIL